MKGRGKNEEEEEKERRGEGGKKGKEGGGKSMPQSERYLTDKSYHHKHIKNSSNQRGRDNQEKKPSKVLSTQNRSHGAKTTEKVPSL